jgi:hypothetical protein
MYLEVFSACAIGNFLLTKLVFHFHPSILRHGELSLYVNNLSRRRFCVEGWSTPNAAKQCHCIVSHIWFYHTAVKCPRLHIVATAYPLLYQNCDICVLTSEVSSVLSSLIISQQILKIVSFKLILYFQSGGLVPKTRRQFGDK